MSSLIQTLIFLGCFLSIFQVITPGVQAGGIKMPFFQKELRSKDLKSVQGTFKSDFSVGPFGFKLVFLDSQGGFHVVEMHSGYESLLEKVRAQGGKMDVKILGKFESRRDREKDLTVDSVRTAETSHVIVESWSL